MERPSGGPAAVGDRRPRALPLGGSACEVDVLLSSDADRAGMGAQFQQNVQLEVPSSSGSTRRRRLSGASFARSMSEVDYPRLLRFARELQNAVDYAALLDVVRAAVADVTPYQHCWLAMFEPDLAHVRILAYAGGDQPVDWEKSQVIPVAGDPMLAEILCGGSVVVVEDAPNDPRTNKEVIAAFGNRTIINVPLSLLDAPIGALGIGTFGEEGVRPPSEQDLHALMAIAGQVSVAAGRLRWLQERAAAEKERAESNRRLAHAQRLESLGLLAGGVAHDFNNILQVVLASAAFIEQGPLASDQRADLKLIVEAAERGAALSRQLLAMGRSQAQRLEPLDLNERLRALVALLSRTVSADVELELLEDELLPTVLGDAAQLDQVFLNLVLNARQAMHGGRLTMQSEQVVLEQEFTAAHPWLKPGRYVSITVSDTGEGMTPEVLERIFEPFFSTKGGEGTGLGLAIAYGIVQQHGGMMQAASKLGVGSSFEVFLPVYDRSAASVGVKLVARASVGRERVLVAEDNPQVREVIRRILTQAGYEVQVAVDGEQAVAFALVDPAPDLVLLDAMMPKLNGRQAYEAIRAAGKSPAFLFSSGYAPTLLPASVLVEQGIDVLQKPYEPEQLLSAVRAALDRTGG